MGSKVQRKQYMPSNGAIDREKHGMQYPHNTILVRILPLHLCIIIFS